MTLSKVEVSKFKTTTQNLKLFMFINVLFYLTFLFFSIGQLGRISFLNQQINIYLYEGLVLLVLLVLFGKYGLKPIKESFKNFWLLFIFFLALLLSFLLAIRDFKPLENFIGFLYFLRLFLYFIYFFYLVHHIRNYRKAKQFIERGFFLFVFLTGVSSVLQYFFYPNLRNLMYAGWDPHLYRLFGTFFDTSIAGAVYGLIFLTFLVEGKNLVKNKWILRSLLAIYLVFIVLTYSRSLYIVLMIVTILYAAVKEGYKKLLIFVVIFLLVLIIAPKPFGEGVNLIRTFSIQSRLEDYKIALKIWQKRPIFGYGYNRIRYVKRQMNVIEEVGSDLTHSGASFHSSFLVILVSSGVVGLGLFIGVLYKLAIWSSLSRYLILFVVLLSLTDNILLHPFILFLLFLLITLSANPSRRLR